MSALSFKIARATTCRFSLGVTFAIVMSGVLATLSSQAAYAYENCDEACPAQDEPGKISFLNGVSTEINCCCVEEVEGQAPVSRPLEECDIPPP